jgi:carbon starvation protein
MPGVMLTSGLVVLAWGYFLYQGVMDPLGGINSLWPLFGIANQLLGAIGLCVATTVLLKMHGLKYVWITVGPLLWILSVTFTAGMQKIFSPLPRLGFLARAEQLQAQLATMTNAAQIAQTERLIFNERLDAVICGLFLLMVAAVVADSLRVWAGIVSGRREVRLNEAPFVLTQLKPGEV